MVKDQQFNCYSLKWLFNLRNTKQFYSLKRRKNSNFNVENFVVMFIY